MKANNMEHGSISMKMDGYTESWSIKNGVEV